MGEEGEVVTLDKVTDEERTIMRIERVMSTLNDYSKRPTQQQLIFKRND